MKKYQVALLAASILAGATTVASAADLGRYEGGSMKDGPVYALPATWTGLYIGANAGYTWGEMDWYVVDANRHLTPDFSGGIFGGQIGYNKQFGNLVLGVEASYSGSNAEGSAKCVNNGFDCNVELNSLFLVGPRLGYAFDRSLLYMTGGYALASITTSSTPDATGYTQDLDHSGWSIGGGIEHQITPNLILGVEYQHVELGSEMLVVPGHSNRDLAPDLDIVRARLNYKFGNHSDASLK